MAINDDMAWERVYHVRDILRGFRGHNFVFSLRRLKPKKTNIFNNLIKTLKNFLKT